MCLRYNIEIVLVCHLLFKEQPEGMLNVNQVVDVGYTHVNYDDNTEN